jgi:quinol monooxygenase YgiN
VNRFALVVRFTLKAGHEDSFDDLVRDLLPQIKEHEPGTLVYAVHTVDGHPDERMFYEQYADRDAFAAHEQQPHVQEFLAEREQHLEAVEVDFLELGGIAAHQ